MALNAEALAQEIKGVLESVSHTSVEGAPAPNDPGGEISSSISSLATGIAGAVLNHIKENLVVTVVGTGNQGAPVNSTSNTAAGGSIS